MNFSPVFNAYPSEFFSRPYLNKHWSTIKTALLEGSYYPQPVKQVAIKKPGGGDRLLGIPTVIDRMIQQGIHQVINPFYDPDFFPSGVMVFEKAAMPNRQWHNRKNTSNQESDVLWTWT